MDEIVPNLQPVKFLNDQTFFQIKKSSYSTVEPLQNSQPILLGTSANIEKRRFNNADMSLRWKHLNDIMLQRISKKEYTAVHGLFR